MRRSSTQKTESGDPLGDASFQLATQGRCGATRGSWTTR